MCMWPIYGLGKAWSWIYFYLRKCQTGPTSESYRNENHQRPIQYVWMVILWMVLHPMKLEMQNSVDAELVIIVYVEAKTNRCLFQNQVGQYYLTTTNRYNVRGFNLFSRFEWKNGLPVNTSRQNFWSLWSNVTFWMPWLAVVKFQLLVSFLPSNSVAPETSMNTSVIFKICNLKQMENWFKIRSHSHQLVIFYWQTFVRIHEIELAE